jgi:hypothetical protein
VKSQRDSPDRASASIYNWIVIASAIEKQHPNLEIEMTYSLVRGEGTLQTFLGERSCPDERESSQSAEISIAAIVSGALTIEDIRKERTF